METTKSNISINDFSKICRLCLSADDVIPFMLLEELKFYENIPDIIKKNEDDRLPKKICETCVKELEYVASILEKCKESELILTTILEQEKHRVLSPIYDMPDNTSVSDNDDSPLVEQIIVSFENGKKECHSPIDTHIDIKEQEKPQYSSSNVNDNKSRSKNFQCANCGKKFHTKRELVIHMQIHSETRPFSCQECNMKFKFRQSLKRHRLVHSSERPYKCDVCGKGFKRAFARNIHRRIIHNGVKMCSAAESKYSCIQCDRVFTSHLALNGHMATHTSETPYSCSYCGKQFPYISSLNVHTRIHTGETRFICSICNKGYCSSTNLKRHKETIHYEIEDVKGKSENEDTQDQIEETSQNADKRECKICNKIVRKRGLAPHMRIHKMEKKKFICTFCGKNFQKNSHLEAHIRIHTGERPYVCKICKKTFKQLGDLKRHVVLHTGEKQFQCQHCGKQYSTKGTLDNHMIVHTGVRRPVNFECNICKKSFRQCTHYKTHMKSHTGEKPYLCTICGKSFTASSTLKVHTRIHTGETPFVCSHCNKGYKTSSCLKGHMMRSHTGEKRHVCIICYKRFHDSTNLKRHKKRVHSVVDIKKEDEMPVDGEDLVL